VELLVTGNPDPDSRLPYLIRVPVGAGLVFATSGTWPRMKALYCHPIPIDEWPAGTEVVERVELRSCRRRGAAIDVLATRARENRSQLVYTTRSVDLHEKTGGANYGAGPFESGFRHTEGSLRRNIQDQFVTVTKMGGYQGTSEVAVRLFAWVAEAAGVRSQGA
jgi:hypothetical protein